MKIKDTYNSYKIKYKEYVVLIKSGIFYDVLNDDIGIMYSLFHYKINCSGDNYIVGFPEKNLVKVTDMLKQNKINYIVLDKDNSEYKIVDKFKTNKNKYNNYKIDLVRLNYLTSRIEKIYEKLNSMMINSDIEKILLKIEELL